MRDRPGVHALAWLQNPREYVTVNDRRHIVQEYISSPLLVDMLKFDLRVYVVVTSIEPLEVRSLMLRYCCNDTLHPATCRYFCCYVRVILRVFVHLRLVGGVAQWLGRRSLAGGLFLTYA